MTLRKLPADEMAQRLDWVRPISEGHIGTGFDAVGGWPASIWVLGMLFERTDLPDLTREDAHAQGWRGYDVDPPHPPWTRLRWHTLAQRHNFGIAAVSGRWPDLVYTWQQDWDRSDVFPSHGNHPDIEYFLGSWPIGLILDAPGNLGEPLLSALVDVLLRFTDPRHARHCEMFWDVTFLGLGEALFTGPLTELSDLIDDVGEVRRTPSNIWPPDRSWFVYTDYDLSVTKVSGTQELVDAIHADPTLETLRITS